MQQPDANGFVTISWPSKSIPHGGIFHTRVAEPTNNQQEFLKVLQEESKLTIAQRAKTALNLRQADEREVEYQPVRVPMVRPRTSQRRSLSAIRESGVFDIDGHRPLKRGEDREKMKERLAYTMAYGDAKEPPRPPVPLRTAKPKPKLPTAKEKWHDLITQIRERSEWLAEMEYLGEAGPHRELIKDQIAERMRALDALGIDSEVSTPRSTVSAFSTTRSREPVKSAASSIQSGMSNRSGREHPPRATSRMRPTEENVAAFAQLSPLQYTPRRRV